MFHSIRLRIAIPYLLLILAVMLGLSAYLSRLAETIYTNNLENQLLSEARLIAASLPQTLDSSNSSIVLDDYAKNAARHINARVTLIAADGTVVGESNQDPASMENHLHRPEIQAALIQGQGSSNRYSFSIGYRQLYTALRVPTQGPLVGFVRLAVPLDQVQRDIEKLQHTFLGATLLTAALAILLAVLIANRTTRPLRDLTLAAGQLANQELNGRILPTTRDEIGQLTEAFNRMAVQLHYQIESLEQERARMAAILEEMSDGLLIVDKNGAVQQMNPAAESVFETRQELARGRSLVEVVRHHQIVELWRNSQATGRPQSGMIDIPGKGLYLQSIATPLSEPLPDATLLLFQNLSRLRQLETVRRDFISNVSHELRTPLASLKALTETLQDSALEDPPAARRFLQQMETEVDALSLMVQELLELSRIESGRVPLQLQPTAPFELIANSVERLKIQAERAGLILQIDCPEDLPDIQADRGRLEQVMVNLLHNAIKFTPAGGVVQVMARCQGEQVLFSVQDTGPGIPPADLPRIFERFFKADRARSSGGTGLGLAISRHLVEAHHGRIWAESQEGQGSTFSFTIPVAQPSLQ